LVACWCPLDHLKEEEEDFTPLSIKLCQVEILQETLILKIKIADNRTIDEEKEQQHLQTPKITLFTCPTLRYCLSLLHHIMPLPILPSL